MAKAIEHMRYGAEVSGYITTGCVEKVRFIIIKEINLAGQF